VQIVRSSEELDSAAKALRASASLALVPTMGALHAGHMALIAAARKQADHVVATIFVNPTQFGANEDLDRYPRREQEDAALLRAAGCDLLWLPGTRDIYPDGFATTVSVAGLSRRWEGEVRPGHFDGVATVVAKLLLAVRPDMALFGEKDFQQLAVIRRMALDLNLGTAIQGVPTVRDSDGLALSSRNAYLSDDERARAVALPHALQNAAEMIRSGTDIGEALQAGRSVLQEAGFVRSDYFALIDATTLDPIEAPKPNMRLIAAAVIGKTRLIDNVPV
jgi:pantoate--beta-alanine ligase